MAVGVAVGVGEAVGVGVDVGAAVGVGVGTGVGVGVGAAVAVGVGVGTAVGVGDGVGRADPRQDTSRDTATAATATAIVAERKRGAVKMRRYLPPDLDGMESSRGLPCAPAQGVYIEE